MILLHKYIDSEMNSSTKNILISRVNSLTRNIDFEMILCCYFIDFAHMILQHIDFAMILLHNSIDFGNEFPSKNILISRMTLNRNIDFVNEFPRKVCWFQNDSKLLIYWFREWIHPPGILISHWFPQEGILISQMNSPTRNIDFVLISPANYFDFNYEFPHRGDWFLIDYPTDLANDFFCKVYWFRNDLPHQECWFRRWSPLQSIWFRIDLPPLNLLISQWFPLQSILISHMNSPRVIDFSLISQC